VPNSTNKLLLELARNPTEALRLLPPKNMQLPVSAMTTWSTPISKLSMKIKRRAEDKLKLEGDEKTGLEIVRRAAESPPACRYRLEAYLCYLARRCGSCVIFAG
jgi:hypothetical protein